MSDNKDHLRVAAEKGQSTYELGLKYHFYETLVNRGYKLLLAVLFVVGSVAGVDLETLSRLVPW